MVVRHAGKKYDVEVDLEEPGLTFKMQLFSLTGVPPERQKILVKGGQLKDDTDMKSLGLKPNHSFMMLGTAGELPKGPVETPKFIEDMTDQQLAQSSEEPAGLVNVGQTCYANSTLQALKSVPELRESLNEYKSAGGSNDLTGALRDLYKGMANTTRAYYPVGFLNALRLRFPQFDERGNDGSHKQQDAEEAWSQILATIRPNLRLTIGGGNGESEQGQNAINESKTINFVDKYFGGTFETCLKCDEVPDEPATVGTESFLKLECHITITTNFLKDGLIEGLKEKIEKHNDNLGRNAQYTLTKKITRLPKYLTVHYMRFFWRRDTMKKSKILRKVAFPFELDVTELCSDELQKKLMPAREKIREIQKAREELIRDRKRAKYNMLTTTKGSASVNSNGNDMEYIKPEENVQFEKDLAQVVDSEVAKDVTSNHTGLYQLTAIITHGGSSADSGHYQCYSRHSEPGKWWRFNDDKVSIVDDTRIEQLSGGGESDSALILLYKSSSM